MKTSVKVIFCVLFVLALLAVSCVSKQTNEAAAEPEAAAASNELVGVWKVAEVTFDDPQTPAVTEPETGIAIITDHYVSFTGATAPRDALPENPTDAQLAAAFKVFNALVSKYEINGNIITAEPIVNINPNVKPGDTGTMEYKLEEGNLFITPKSTPEDPLETPYTLKFARIE